MLIIDGKDSLDIFKMLIKILQAKCIELFTNEMKISLNQYDFEKDVKPLNDFFKTLGIKIIWNIREDILVKKCDTNCVLKDYMLWIKLSHKHHLSISFDYFFEHSAPCHLE